MLDVGEAANEECTQFVMSAGSATVFSSLFISPTLLASSYHQGQDNANVYPNQIVRNSAVRSPYLLRL